MTDIWIPIHIVPNEDMIQKKVCQQMQNEVGLSERKGGCYGISCDECILDSSHLAKFSIWACSGITQSSQPKSQQFDLF